MERGKDKTKQ